MRLSNGGPLDDPLNILKWGYRALYVLLFISLIVAMGRLALPFTIAFLGSIFSLLFPMIFSEKEIFEPWDFSYLID